MVDKGGPEPNPDTDTIVPMKNILTVDFKLPDGTVWKTQEVKYGQQAVSYTIVGSVRCV